MGYSIFVFPTERVALFRFQGIMTADQGLAAFQDYLKHDNFDPSFTMLTDARNVIDVDAKFLDILAKVSSLKPVLQKFQAGALSVILVEHMGPFGMARMLGHVLNMFCEIELRVASTLHEIQLMPELSHLDIPGLLGDKRQKPGASAQEPHQAVQRFPPKSPPQK